MGALPVYRRAGFTQWSAAVIRAAACLGTTVGYHRYFTHGSFKAKRPLRVALAVVTLVAPAVIGGLVTWSWFGAVTAFLWASLVRITFLHHVTWSVNSVCHMIGERPFADRDKSANFWAPAVLSMGEAWHNLHHADPTQARHGVRPGQIDISARVIWIHERLGWAYDVHWPTPERLARIARAGHILG